VTVAWSARATLEFEEIIAWIAIEKPVAAQEVSKRILKAVELLGVSPMIGRPGRTARTREHPVPRTPYILVYLVSESDIQIIALRRGARQWQGIR
jgi:plasmid stabilization system protein ParE